MGASILVHQRSKANMSQIILNHVKIYTTVQSGWSYLSSSPNITAAFEISASFLFVVLAQIDCCANNFHLAF